MHQQSIPVDLGQVDGPYVRPSAEDGYGWGPKADQQPDLTEWIKLAWQEDLKALSR